MFSSFDTQVQIEETIPCCPYCDNELDGETRNGMHATCDDAFNAELEESYPDDGTIVVEIEESQEFLPLRDEDAVIAILLRKRG
jgi:hypothetical protein